jgi:hypothetical protein
MARYEWSQELGVMIDKDTGLPAPGAPGTSFGMPVGTPGVTPAGSGEQIDPATQGGLPSGYIINASGAAVPAPRPAEEAAPAASGTYGGQRTSGGYTPRRSYSARGPSGGDDDYGSSELPTRSAPGIGALAGLGDRIRGAVGAGDGSGYRQQVTQPDSGASAGPFGVSAPSDPYNGWSGPGRGGGYEPTPRQGGRARGQSSRHGRRHCERRRCRRLIRGLLQPLLPQQQPRLQ